MSLSRHQRVETLHNTPAGGTKKRYLHTPPSLPVTCPLLHFLSHLPAEPPSFTVEPEDVHVVKKGFLILPCSAVSSTGEHTHVHWLREGTNISRTGPRHLVLQDNSLVLTNVRVQEAGKYSCVASNSHGQSLSTAIVTVSSECSYCMKRCVTACPNGVQD